MTPEEFYEDSLLTDKVETTKRETISIGVLFSGYRVFEYEDCTLEEARNMAIADLYDELPSDVEIDEITEE